MLNKIQFNNPVLHYRLDPGEPGIPYPSRASMSVARVASHEAGNIMRFRSKAAREGGIVVDTKIYLNRKQVGPYLAATSGYSEARIIYPDRRSAAVGKQEAASPVIDNNFTKDPSENVKPENDKEDNSINYPNDNEQDLNNNLDSKIKDLEEQERILTSDLADITKRVFKEDDSFKALKSRKQQEVQKVKQKLAYLKVKKKFDKQNELLMKFSSQISFSEKLIKARYNIGNTTSNLINILI